LFLQIAWLFEICETVKRGFLGGFHGCFSSLESGHPGQLTTVAVAGIQVDDGICFYYKRKYLLLKSPFKSSNTN